MSAPIVKLFTQPNFAWTDIRREEEAHPRHYLAHLLVLALIPAVCLFVGTTYVGWSLAAGETVKLSAASAVQLCVLLYLTIVIGVALMGGFIRWMSRSFDTRPTPNQCIGFAAYTVTPFSSPESPAFTQAAGWPFWCWGRHRCIRRSCCSSVCRRSCMNAGSKACCTRRVSGASVCWCW